MPHIPRSTAPTGGHAPLDLGALAAAREGDRPRDGKRPVERVVGLDTISLRKWQVDPAKILEQMTGKKPKKLSGSLVDPDAAE